MNNQNQQKTVAPIAQQQNPEKGTTMYNVAGQEVKLSYQIVRDFLVKGGGNVSDQDLTLFISTCRFNQLNPFLNEAYLVKYGNSPAQMVVSKEALMKRADACENYAGFQAGIIVKRDGEYYDVEGCFHRDDEELVGGWAKVYRTDRKYPYVSRVNLSEYNKKQSLWNEKPSTMISKIAKVQALREAFPAQLGAMYTREESNVQDAEYIEIKDEISHNANKTSISMGGASVEKKAPDENKQEAEHSKLNAPGF